MWFKHELYVSHILRISCRLSLNPPQSHEVDTVVLSILHVRKLRLVCPVNMARKWRSQP